MGVVGTVRGVSGRQGIFLSGKPQQLIGCDDGLVLLTVSGFAAPLGSPLAGSLVQAQVQQPLRRQSYADGRPSAEMLSRELPRSIVLLWTQVTAAVLATGFPGRRLRLTATVNGPEQHLLHRYGRLAEADDWLARLLATHLGDRFDDARQRA